MDENFRAELLAAKNADQFLDICSKYEMEKFADELGEATEDKKENTRKRQDTESLQLQHVRPVSHIHLWQRKPLRKKEMKWAFRSRLKQMDPAVLRIV